MTEDERCTNHVPPERRPPAERELQLLHDPVRVDDGGRRPAAAHVHHGGQSPSGHHLDPLLHLSLLQPGRVMGGLQGRQAQIPRQDADRQPDGGRSAGDLRGDARGRRVEHHDSVACRRLCLQAADVSQAAGHVLLRLRHGGDQSGQAVSHPQPSGHQ